MFTNMEFWTEIRSGVLKGEVGKRAACRECKIHWGTPMKIRAHAEPSGYRRSEPRGKPKIELFLPIIHEILEADRQAPRMPRPLPATISWWLDSTASYAGVPRRSYHF